MSIATLAEVRALVSTGLGDPELQAVINREEDYLSDELGAPVAGERIQQVWRTGRSGWVGDSIYLARPTDALDEITDNGVDVDPAEVLLLGNGTIVERVARGWTGPLVEFTYTPNDALAVARVEIELVRLTLAETGFNSEDIGDYKYQRSGILQATSMQIQSASRRALVRTLVVPRPRPRSVRLVASQAERISA